MDRNYPGAQYIRGENVPLIILKAKYMENGQSYVRFVQSI